MTLQRIITLAVGLLVFISLVATAAAREDDGPMNKKKCEEMGGVWHNEEGKKYCATWQVIEDDDDIATDDSVDLGEFVAQVQTRQYTIIGVLVYSQQGNVGAPGTGEPELEERADDRVTETTVLRCFKQLPNGRLQEMPLGPCEAAMNR